MRDSRHWCAWVALMGVVLGSSLCGCRGKTEAPIAPKGELPPREASKIAVDVKEIRINQEKIGGEVYRSWGL